MIGAVDIGGTKTLVAVFDEHGKIVEQQRFETSQNYNQFLKDLEEVVAKLSTKDFKRMGVAVPGRLDREHGIGLSFGNLSGWKNVPIEVDCERLFNCPVVVENDAKLGGLSEALLIIKEFKKTLYITISTGIGISLIIDGIIDRNIGDRGGNAIMLEHRGHVMSWESFASGKAIVKKYGKRASEINDPEIWKVISRDLAVGIIDLIAVMEPEVIVIGGGVGAHFEKFGGFLMERLKDYEIPIMKIPPIRQAKRPEEAVIYGCYQMAKAHAKPH